MVFDLRGKVAHLVRCLALALIRGGLELVVLLALGLLVRLGAGEVILEDLERLALRVEVRLGDLRCLRGLRGDAGDVRAGVLELGEGRRDAAAHLGELLGAGRGIALELGKLVLEALEATRSVVRGSHGGLDARVACVDSVVCGGLGGLDRATRLAGGTFGVFEGALCGAGELAIGSEVALVGRLERGEGILGREVLCLEGRFLRGGSREVRVGLRELGVLDLQDGVVVLLDLMAVVEFLLKRALLVLGLGELVAGGGVRALGRGDLAYGGKALRD